MGVACRMEREETGWKEPLQKRSVAKVSIVAATSLVLLACVAVFYLPHGRKPLVGAVGNFDLLDQTSLQDAANVQLQELESVLCVPASDKTCKKCHDDCKKKAQKAKVKGVTPPFKWSYYADAEEGKQCNCTLTTESGKKKVVMGGGSGSSSSSKLQPKSKSDSHKLAQLPPAKVSSEAFVDKVLRRAKHMKDLAS